MNNPAANPTKPRLAYGMEELATALGVSRSFVYQEKAAGRLRTFKLGRRTLVSDEEARRIVAAAQEAEA